MFVLTTASTCSASESIINSLRGVNIQVIEVGSTTCGKPYGFYPADNCGVTYFTIEFQGINAQGFGDYPDGFTPQNTVATEGVLLPGCSVADDFTHALGDSAEGLLASALSYQSSGACPVPPSGMAVPSNLGQSIKSIWQQNRISRPRRAMIRAMGTPAAEIEIDEPQARQLLAAQHPDLADLSIVSIASGWDNHLLRLGDNLALRFPRRQLAAQLILNEQRWLPHLKERLPLAIPAPVRIGVAQFQYPWAWSVTPWIEGETADLSPPDSNQGERLAAFFEALHKPAPADAPHNPYRSVPLSERAEVFADRLAKLDGKTAILDRRVHALVERCLGGGRTTLRPTWIHGDLHPRNVLVAKRLPDRRHRLGRHGSGRSCLRSGRRVDASAAAGEPPARDRGMPLGLRGNVASSTRLGTAVCGHSLKLGLGRRCAHGRHRRAHDCPALGGPLTTMNKIFAPRVAIRVYGSAAVAFGLNIASRLNPRY